MITSCDEILELAKGYTTIPIREILRRYDNADFAAAPHCRPVPTAFSCWRAWRAAKNGRATPSSATTRFHRTTCKNGTVTLRCSPTRRSRPTSRSPCSANCSAIPHCPARGSSRRSRAVSSATSCAMLGYAEPTLNIKRGAWDDFDLMLFDKVIAATTTSSRRSYSWST